MSPNTTFKVVSLDNGTDPQSLAQAGYVPSLLLFDSSNSRNAVPKLTSISKCVFVYPG
jgi:hypothetical protein